MHGSPLLHLFINFSKLNFSARRPPPCHLFLFAKFSKLFLNFTVPLSSLSLSLPLHYLACFHHQIQPLMEDGWQRVCTPTPRKSLVRPPVLSSFWVLRRFKGCICNWLRVDRSLGFSMSLVSSGFALYSPQNLFPSWTKLLSHFNPKLPRKGSDEVAPIWAAFCNKAVADMFPRCVWWEWCWILYKEGTLIIWLPADSLTLLNGSEVLLVSSWSWVLPDDCLLPNTQLNWYWSDGGGFEQETSGSTYTEPELVEDPSWWISWRSVLIASWPWDPWPIHRESPRLAWSAVSSLLEGGLKIQDKCCGKVGASEAPIKW